MPRRGERIRSPREFRSIFDHGRKAASGPVVCFVRASGEARPPRAGVAASRKVGGAVVRNRAKRLLRESVATVIRELPPGTDVVLVATPSIVGKSFQDVRASVEGAVKRALAS